MDLLPVGPLPEDALGAAAQFHADVLPKALSQLEHGGDLVLIFGPADHTHRDWRSSIVRGLARRFAPARVNAVAGEDEAAIAASIAYLEGAPGVTGQLLPVHGTGAGTVLYP